MRNIGSASCACGAGSNRRQQPMADDHAHFDADQISREIVQALIAPVSPTVFNGDVLPLGVPKLAEGLPECLNT